MHFVKTNKTRYCGIDLHSKSMMLCIVNREGKILFRKRLANNFALVHQHLLPYLPDLAVAVESTFNWYWLVDACREHGIEIHLGHATYMKSVYGGKNKSDRLDCIQIANLLRSGMLPFAHAYPQQHRGIRDLLRRRLYYSQTLSSFQAHGRVMYYQNGIIDIESGTLKRKKGRSALIARLPDNGPRSSVRYDIETIEHLQDVLRRLERELVTYTRRAEPNRSVEILKSLPGVGDILGHTMYYETGDLLRFKKRQRFSSYTRLVRPQRESNGKFTGHGNARIGDPYLKWAFMEILNTAPKVSPVFKTLIEQLSARHGRLKARAILAHKLCIAVYYMLKRQEPFDESRFEAMIKKDQHPLTNNSRSKEKEYMPSM